MDKSELKKLKIEWVKKTWIKLIIAIAIMILFFVLYFIYKKIIFDIVAIIFGFISFFYFNNNLKSYIEKNIYKE